MQQTQTPGSSGPVCSTCHGSGMVYNKAGDPVICPMCEGTGVAFNPGRYFTYELGPTILTGGGTAQSSSVQVLNRPFRWMMAVAVSTFPFSTLVSDSRDLRPFSNQAVHSSNLWGTAQQPMPLLTPFRFNKNANILATITDLGGGAGQAGVTNGSTAVTWVSGATFLPGNAPAPNPSWVGQSIVLAGVTYAIAAVPSAISLTLSTNYLAATTTVAYNVGNTVRLGFVGVELDGE